MYLGQISLGYTGILNLKKPIIESK